MIHRIYNLWSMPVIKPPSQIMPPKTFGKGKPTRHNPQPNGAGVGKRKRQWR